MNYQIRKLEQSDLDMIAKLYIAAYDDDIWSEKWQYIDAYNRIKEIVISPEAIALAYIEDDEILGCILCSLMSWHTGKQLEVKEFFVNPLCQNQGIGFKLMKQVESLIFDQGVTEIFLWTRNEERLTKFYKKCGYDVVTETIQMSKKFKEDIL